MARQIATAKPQLNQMAVHEYGDVAVVRFADPAQHAFIVDVWVKSYALSVQLHERRARRSCANEAGKSGEMNQAARCRKFGSSTASSPIAGKYAQIW